MKDHLNAAMRSFVCALVCAALGALCIALMLALYDIERTVMLSIGTWVLALALQAVINELLLARGTSQLFFLAVNAALLLFFSGELVSRTVFIPSSAGFPILLRIAFFTSGYICAYAARKDPGSNIFVRCADALILSAATYLAAAFLLGDALHFPILILALAAFALTLVMTASMRAGGESDSVVRGTGIGGWLVLLALLALCLLFTAGILGVSTGHIDSIVALIVLLWQLVNRAGRLALHALAWFLSLFVGKSKFVQVEPVFEVEEATEFQDFTPVDLPQWVVYLFWAVVGAAAIAVLIVVIRLLARTRITKQQRLRRRCRVTRKGHFFSELRALLSALFASVSFEVAYRFGPPSVQRLYVLAVRTGRLHRLGRKKSESPGAYLRRYHCALCRQQAASGLDELAALLDAAFYGGAKPQLSRREYEHYAAEIRQLHSPEKAAAPKQTS